MKRKIIILGGTSASFTTFRLDLLRRLHESDFAIVCIVPEDEKYSMNTAILKKYNIMFYTFPFERTSLSITSIIKPLLKISSIIKAEKPNIVFSYTLKPNIIAGVLSYFHSFKFICLINGLGYVFTSRSVLSHRQKLLKYLVSKLINISLRNISHVLFQNFDDPRYCIDNGILNTKSQQKIKIVRGSGVSTDFYYPVERQVSKKTKFVMVSRLLFDKGILEYLEAAKEMRFRYPGLCEFHLLGGLDQNPSCIPLRLLNQYIDAGDVLWWGNVKDVRKFLKSSDVFVLPSYREGLPRSAIEAASMCLPLVLSDAPGCRELVIEHYNGYLAEVQSVESLVCMLSQYIANPALAIEHGVASRKIVIEHFSNDVINNEMISIFESLHG